MSILKLLEDERVFSVTKGVDGRFRFEEMCDNYFDVLLTAEEVIALCHELLALVTK